MLAELLPMLARASDASNIPLGGAKWHFYQSGTATPQSVFTTAALSVAHANPVVADGAGKFAPIYFDSRLSYRGVLTSSDGALTIFDIDPISSGLVAALASTASGEGADLVAGAYPVVRVTDYGFNVADTTGEANLAALKAAVAAAPEGATIYIPPTGPLAAKIYTSGGASSMVRIAKRLNLVIDGNLEATATISGANASLIFDFIAGSEGSKLAGSGKISGDGTIRDTNLNEPELDRPCLVRVRTNNFTCSGVTFAKIPQIALHLYECSRSLVQGCQFTGGPIAYSEPGHFGIRSEDGGDHTFAFNRFYPDENGGMQVQCILNSGSDDCLLIGNHARYPYEKLIYSVGDRNTAIGNIVVGNPGFIPNTNQRGTITPAFRFHGSNNQMIANRTHNCAGGTTMMDGTGHRVENNVFLGCGQSAIASLAVPGGVNNLTGSKITNNRCTRDPSSGFLAGDGIRLVSTTPATKLVVSGNDVDGFSVSDPLSSIAVWANNTPYGEQSVIKPSVGNGRYYVATTSGTSGASEPTWDATAGNTTADGTVVWTAVAYEAGQSEIRIIGKDAADPIEQSTISGNATSGGPYGIVTQYVTDSQMKDNQVSATQWGLTESNGVRNNWRGNTVVGTSNTSVQGISETSKRASGLPFAWTPNQGSGLTVTGTFSSKGWCIEDGEIVHVQGVLQASTGLYNTGGGILCTNLPVGAAEPAAGSLMNTDVAAPTGCTVVPAPIAGAPVGATPTTLFGGATGTRTTLIFSITYRKGG